MQPTRRRFAALASSAVFFAVARPVLAQEPLRILATGVFVTSLNAMAEPFEAASGHKLQVSIANAGQVAARVIAGEPADLVMSSSASIKALAKQGLLAPDEIAIGKMRLGVAVPAGSPAPDLTSVEAFRMLLTLTEKVAYIDPNGGGTSGPFFEKMFASLGIADAVHAKAVLCKDGGEVVEAVASRSATVGMTQASELIGADGIVFAGFIPEPLNLTTQYSASLAAQSKSSKAAAAFLAFIGGHTAANHLRRAGWDVAK